MYNILRRLGSMTRFDNMPIGRRLSIIVVGISIITLLIVVYIALISTTLTLRQTATSTLTRQNRNIASALDRRLHSLYFTMHDRIAPRLARAYEPGISLLTLRDEVLEVTRLETNLLLQRIVVYIPGETVGVFNFVTPNSGSDILTRGISADRIPEDAWFVRAYETGETGWFGLQSDILETPTNQLASLVIPIMVDDRSIGLMLAEISPSTLNILLRDTIDVLGDLSNDDNGYTLMVGREGNVTAAYNAKLRPADLMGLSQIVLRQDGITDVDGVFPDQERAFALNNTMPNTGWHLVTVLPDSALPELPYQTVLQILAISAIGLIALVWSINRFVGATVARPALSLNAAAASIGAGNLAYKIPFQLQEQRDEIGTMARALEDMRLNLEMLYNTLEQRVTERTAQLEIARQQAQANAAELRAVYDESLSVVSEYQLQLILQNFIQRILTLLNADYCGVWLRRRTNDQELRLVAHTYPDQSMTNVIVKLGEGLAGTVTLNATPLIVDHYSRFPSRLNLSNLGSIERALCVPLISSGQAIGAVMAGRPESDVSFTENDQRLLTLFANLVAPVVRSAQLFVDLDEARHEADRANQVKTRFLASVTHELRTPLNLIINNMDFMRIGAFGDVTEEQTQRLNQTIRSAEHLLYLINDLLDVSKIEAGEMQLFIQPTDIHTVLDDALDATEMLLDQDDKRNTLTFTTNIPDNLPLVPMDARRVRQVLLNLLSNAIKFTLEGEVEFAVVQEATQLRFSIRDTGIGIPEEERPAMFSAFERTNNAKQLAIEGTGLGLAISRYLVREHGGELDFVSETGKGSTFWFTLPLSVPEAPEPMKNQTQVMHAIPRR